MSTSRAKQQAQGRRSKTKKSGNGSKCSEAKNKKMKKGPKFHGTGMTKKRRSK
jgi:hypothetical protein